MGSQHSKKHYDFTKGSFPYPNQPSTLEELEPDTDDDIIDITDFSERLANDRRSPLHKQKFMTPTVTQGHCPTPQNSPTYLAMNVAAMTPAKPTEQRSGESSLTREEYPVDGPHA